ncbi:MAG: hypothetical protein E7514_07145 [Ruminococcaceae bacterium]|nr:hypothetical protein [Oscillospiraceae bacterium]
MIRFLPALDSEKLKALYPDKQFEDAQYCRYDAEENGNITGSILAEVKGYNCFLSNLDTESGNLTAEGLIRSALNFGANRGAYMAFADISGFGDVLANLGFADNNGVLCGEIPELLKGSCCKENK